MAAERASLSDRRTSDDLIVAIDKGPGKGEGFVNVTEIGRRCARAEAEVARLRAALETLPDRVRALGGFQKFREGEVWVSRDDVLRLLGEAGGEDR